MKHADREPVSVRQLVYSNSMAGIKPLPEDQYEQEIHRTEPDFVVYRPCGQLESDNENQQIIVMPTASGAFLATWSQATHEDHADQRVVVARSEDRGRTWGNPEFIDGATPEQLAGEMCGKFLAGWPFFIEAPELKRIYLFYNKNLGVTDLRASKTGVLRFRYRGRRQNLECAVRSPAHRTRRD